VTFHERHDKEENESSMSCAERFEWFNKVGNIRRIQTKDMLEWTGQFKLNQAK